MEAESRLFPSNLEMGDTERLLCPGTLLGFTLCVLATVEITYVSFPFVLNSY